MRVGLSFVCGLHHHHHLLPYDLTQNNTHTHSRSTSWGSMWGAWCRRTRAASTWRPSTGRTGACLSSLFWRVGRAGGEDPCWRGMGARVCEHVWSGARGHVKPFLSLFLFDETHRRFEDGAGQMWGVDSGEVRRDGGWVGRSDHIGCLGPAHRLAWSVANSLTVPCLSCPFPQTNGAPRIAVRQRDPHDQPLRAHRPRAQRQARHRLRERAAAHPGGGESARVALWRAAWLSCCPAPPSLRDAPAHRYSIPNHNSRTDRSSGPSAWARSCCWTMAPTTGARPTTPHLLSPPASTTRQRRRRGGKAAEGKSGWWMG